MVVSNVLQSSSRSIILFLEHLIESSKLGVCQRSATVLELKSGSSTADNHPNCDRFKVNIAYAGLFAQWEVIFNDAYPELPPDFLFPTSDHDFMPNIENLKSLDNWDYTDPAALSNVLGELLEEYRRHHLNLIEQHSRLKYEYSEIINHNEGWCFKPEDIEAHVAKKNGMYGQVNFMLRLPIEFSKLPIYLSKNQPGEDWALLLLSMESPDNHRVKPQLFLSPRLKQILGPVENLGIPQFPQHGLLIEYIPNVCDVLKNKVKQVVSSYELRRDFVNAFLTHYDRSVLEFDAESFRKLSVLMEWHDFFFIVTLEFPTDFPAVQPRLIWQSIYHESTDGKPFHNTNQSYPYSPRWTATEMVERLRSYILEKVRDFQRQTVTEGKLSVD